MSMRSEIESDRTERKTILHRVIFVTVTLSSYREIVLNYNIHKLMYLHNEMSDELS